MKKAIVTLSVILLTAVSAFAGGDNSYLYAKPSQNWFIDASGTLNAWYGRNNLYYQNAAGDFGRFGGSLKVGKLISPVWALRVAADMNQATNGVAGDYIYESVHADVMLSLMDWLGGYRDDRVYRMILFGGFGIGAHATEWLQVKGLNLEYAPVAGIVNSFRLGDNVDFHIDLQAAAPKWTIESMPNGSNHWDENLVQYNLTAGLGLTWFLGGRHFDVCPACPEVNCPEVNCPEPTADCQRYIDEIAGLQARIKELENKNCPEVNCENVESAPFSIFFNRDSYQLRDNRDLVNLEQLAKVAKENGYKINLRGTCDSATATSEYNKTLAENRCRKVKDELVKLGVAESNIIMNPVGGVSELKPTEYDRRVLITFSK